MALEKQKNSEVLDLTRPTVQTWRQKNKNKTTKSRTYEKNSLSLNQKCKLNLTHLHTQCSRLCYIDWLCLEISSLSHEKERDFTSVT